MADTHDHGHAHGGEGHSHGGEGHSHGGEGHSHGGEGHSHGDEGHTPTDAHGHEIFKAYMVVAVALCVFTSLSFLFNYQVRHGHFSSATGFSLILLVAVCKALLVGAYFMHLKFEWRKLYFMIIPAFILGFMMMTVLLPDIVFVWTQK